MFPGPLHTPRIDCPRSVHVVAHAVAVRIRSAVAATHAQGVKLVAIAIAVACRDLHNRTPSCRRGRCTRRTRRRLPRSRPRRRTPRRRRRRPHSRRRKHQGIEVQARAIVQRGSLVVACVLVRRTLSTMRCRRCTRRTRRRCRRGHPRRRTPRRRRHLTRSRRHTHPRRRQTHSCRRPCLPKRRSCKADASCSLPQPPRSCRCRTPRRDRG